VSAGDNLLTRIVCDDRHHLRRQSLDPSRRLLKTLVGRRFIERRLRRLAK